MREYAEGGTTIQGSRRRVADRSKIASRTERKDRESYEAEVEEKPTSEVDVSK